MDAEPKLGEWTPTAPATQQIDDICQKVKSDFEHQLGSTSPEFVPFAYKVRNLIGGSKYIVKVYTGSRQCYILTIQMQMISGGNTVYKLEKMEKGHLFEPLPLHLTD